MRLLSILLVLTTTLLFSTSCKTSYKTRRSIRQCEVLGKYYQQTADSIQRVYNNLNEDLRNRTRSEKYTSDEEFYKIFEALENSTHYALQANKLYISVYKAKHELIVLDRYYHLGKITLKEYNKKTRKVVSNLPYCYTR